jgi:hypothetical protein
MSKNSTSRAPAPVPDDTQIDTLREGDRLLAEALIPSLRFCFSIPEGEHRWPLLSRGPSQRTSTATGFTPRPGTLMAFSADLHRYRFLHRVLEL